MQGVPPLSLLRRPTDTLASVLAHHAATGPDRTFLAFEPDPGVVETTTWRGFADRVAATAGALRRRGVHPGDRVHVHLANTPEFYDLWFAVAALGAVLVPSNPLATADELAHLVAHSGAGLSVTTRVEIPGGRVLHYEEFLVGDGAQPTVRRVFYEGDERSRPAPGVLDALARPTSSSSARATPSQVSRRSSPSRAWRPPCERAASRWWRSRRSSTAPPSTMPKRDARAAGPRCSRRRATVPPLPPWPGSTAVWWTVSSSMTRTPTRSTRCALPEPSR